MSTHGRFRARLTGRTLGNVLLRRAQHEVLSDRDRTLAIARQYVAGKVQNARTLMLRAARDTPGEEEAADSIRIYRLREPIGRYLQVFGVPPKFDQRGPLVF